MPRNFKELKPAYGFDDVAIAPGDITINPEMADLSTNFDGIKLDVPFIASAMDAVVDPKFAIEMTKAGGMGVMNMDGLHTRYEDTTAIYEEIAASPREEATAIMQRIYSAPQKPERCAASPQAIHRESRRTQNRPFLSSTSSKRSWTVGQAREVRLRSPRRRQQATRDPGA